MTHDLPPLPSRFIEFPGCRVDRQEIIGINRYVNPQGAADGPYCVIVLKHGVKLYAHCSYEQAIVIHDQRSRP